VIEVGPMPTPQTEEPERFPGGADALDDQSRYGEIPDGPMGVDLPIGKNPEFMRMQPDGGKAYVTFEPSSSGKPPGKGEKNDDSGAPAEVAAIDLHTWTARSFLTGGRETEGIEFSKGGLSDPDEPPIAVRDLTGAMTAWIDIGSPDATRLHRAAKLAPRVAVYMHKDPAQYLRSLSGARIHRGDSLELLALDRALIAGLAGRLERRMAFAVSVADRELFVSIADATLTGAVRRCTVE